jgi:choline dehydrogenase
VEYRDAAGRLCVAAARREVVLCAGVVGSPQLLLLSGVGPPAELRAAGVAPVVASPAVGKGYIDHPRVACRWALREGVPAMDLSAFYSHVEGNLYADSGALPLPGAPWPDLQVQQDHVRTNDDMLAALPLSTGFNLKPHAVSPRSVGELTLRSADPAAKPVIDPRYLSDPRDSEVLVAGIKLCRHLVAQPAFDPFRGAELQPGPLVQSDDELVAWVRANVDTGYHPVGSCRMAPLPFGVVDAALQVHGVARLRVADASVMPVIPNGNTQAATFMVAERVADAILRGD